jgi:DNA repair protein SbcC/Rad50
MLMRPHRLRVTAFGAFAGTEQVSFDDLEGLFLLHGETGAGKTTLLDAIAFALYGKVPGVRGDAKRLRSDHAAVDVATEVQLEATIGGRRLRITRKPEQERPKRSGTGMTKTPASVVLEELSPAGDWEVKSTRVGEADAEILALMGMSADQFFQVVLLPQGRFAQFLHADAGARAQLLQKLFGTDRFRAVEDWLADRRRATAGDVAAASAEVDRLVARVAQAAGATVGEDLADQVEWAAGLAARAATQRDAAAEVIAERKRDLDAALVAQREAEQLADRQRRRRDALRRQAELEAAAPAIDRLRAELDAAARAAEVAPVLNEAARAASVASAARRAEEQARAAIRTGRDASQEELRSAGDKQRAQLGRLDALREIAGQAAEEDRAAAAAQTRAARLEGALGKSQAETAQRREARPQAVAARDAASQAAAELPAVRAEADARRRMAADSAALVKERATRERLHEAHLAAREKAVALRSEALRIRAARIDGMRAELARNLVDGTPCPVCGSLDHPELCELTGEPVSREQEDAANAAADKASAEADKAGQEVAAADARIGEAAQRLAEAGFAVPYDNEALTAAARKAEADAEQLQTTAARLTTRAAALAQLQRDMETLDDAIAVAERRQVELTEQRTAALAEAEGAAQRAADSRELLRAQLGGAPDLAAALETARRLAEALTAAADAADETVRTAAEASEADERAARAAAEAGFESTSAARVAQRETRWRREGADRIRRHEADAEAVATLLADPDLDVPLDPPAPVAVRTATVDEAQRSHAAAVDEHAKSEHRAQQLTQLLPRLSAALAALEPLRAQAEEARQLADLAGGLGANQYRMTLSSFVLAARLEEVAAAASERLLTMTAGRYSLVHTDARRGGGRAGLGLLACDSWTGIDRDTSTLSGGETFLASLALALGLADVVTAEAAGTPMEALFVDEGFGTLDEDTLEEVMNVLDGLREGGRIVGIVSHVTELRQRIPAQVHVRKGQHGSHVAVTVG